MGHLLLDLLYDARADYPFEFGNYQERIGTFCNVICLLTDKARLLRPCLLLLLSLGQRRGSFRHPGCRRVWAFFCEMSHLVAPKTLEILAFFKRENFV